MSYLHLVEVNCGKEKERTHEHGDFDSVKERKVKVNHSTSDPNQRNELVDEVNFSSSSFADAFRLIFMFSFFMSAYNFTKVRKHRCKYLNQLIKVSVTE